MRTLEETKQIIIQYIKRAIELKYSKTENFWGRRHWSCLRGATLFILKYRDELRPYALLIKAIRLKWQIEENKMFCVRPTLTKRQRYKLGKMSEIERKNYEWDCRYKNKTTPQYASLWE